MKCLTSLSAEISASRRSLAGINFTKQLNHKLALERVVESYKKDLERKEELINQVSEVFTPIFQSSKSIVNPLEFIDVMKEKGQIHKRYTACVKSTKREMLTLNKGPYACDTSDVLKSRKMRNLNF